MMLASHIDLLKNYESGLPPSMTSPTEITNYIYVENMVSIDESNMQFSVTLNLISNWVDSRLAYTNTSSTLASLDVTSYISKIWYPRVQITDNVKDEGKYCGLSV